MNINDRLIADQIIERIANANGVSAATMRIQIEVALENIWNDTVQPHSFMLNDLFPNGKPTTDELVVALEQYLYDAMIPQIEGWEWDGDGYRNTQLHVVNNIGREDFSDSNSTK